MKLSDTAWKFRDVVKDSKIAPYQIKDAWWLISGSVCRQCNDANTVTLTESKNGKEELTESELAERLWSRFTEMETASYDPSGDETAELKELYDKVQGMDVSYEDSAHADAMEALGKLLLSLKNPEIEELIKRRERLPKLIDYVDGCSYRHRS